MNAKQMNFDAIQDTLAQINDQIHELQDTIDRFDLIINSLDKQWVGSTPVQFVDEYMQLRRRHEDIMNGYIDLSGRLNNELQNWQTLGSQLPGDPTTDAPLPKDK